MEISLKIKSYKMKGVFLGLICSSLFLNACGKATSNTNNASSGSETSGGGNQTTPPSSTYFFVHGKSADGIDVNTHEISSWDKKCQVDLDDPTYANRDIYCTIEMKELDLYHQGVKLNYNVPASNKCVYVKFYPYFFYQFKVGVGPTLVTQSIAVNGTSTFGSSGGDAGGSVTGVGGVPVCGFNYGGLNPDSGYPNCCMGTYTLQVTDLNKPVGEQVTTTTGVQWGGSLGSCLGGTGRDHYPEKIQNFPRPVIYRLGGASAPSNTENSYTITAPISLDHSSNIHIANYLDTPSSPPNAFSAPSSFSAYTPNMYYDWVCYDEAQEQYARIRVSIREWNLASEFAKKSTGNPDSTGNESDWGTPNNDRWDWTDYINAGGFTGYPMIL